MLVLTRSLGERLFIQDGEIKICILGIKGNQVKIGIDAPIDINVHREEIFESIQASGWHSKKVV